MKLEEKIAAGEGVVPGEIIEVAGLLLVPEILPPQAAGRWPSLHLQLISPCCRVSLNAMGSRSYSCSSCGEKVYSLPPGATGDSIILRRENLEPSPNGLAHRILRRWFRLAHHPVEAILGMGELLVWTEFVALKDPQLLGKTKA